MIGRGNTREFTQHLTGTADQSKVAAAPCWTDGTILSCVSTVLDRRMNTELSQHRAGLTDQYIAESAPVWTDGLILS